MRNIRQASGTLMAAAYRAAPVRAFVTATREAVGAGLRGGRRALRPMTATILPLAAVCMSADAEPKPILNPDGPGLGSLKRPIELLQCYDRRRLPVLVWLMPHHFKKPKHALFATVSGEHNKPVIIYDEPLFEKLYGDSRPLKVFAALHECAHHMLGHVTEHIQSAGGGSSTAERRYAQMELDADCWAMQRIREQHLLTKKETYEFMHIVMEYFKTRDDRRLSGTDRVLYMNMRCG